VYYIRRAGWIISSVAVLSSIIVYPIKSARGIVLEQTAVNLSGPPEDRRWMLVDQEGIFLSQRRLPKLALFVPRFENGDIVVEAPGLPALRIGRWSGQDDWISVQLWHDRLDLPHPDTSYDEWFSSFLNYPCRLVYLPDSVVRPVEPPFHQSPWRVSLADGYPLLIAGQSSLDLLNEKLSTPVYMDRFRPNLVIDGLTAHEEDHWREIRIGDVELSVVKPCARCSTVLVNPLTAERGVEPLRTLAQYRRSAQKVMFAQNALVKTPGLLRVGMTVHVNEALS
jgi:uncharacterized protein